MSSKMQALRYHGCKDLRVEEVGHPRMSPGKVLVEVEWCGVRIMVLPECPPGTEVRPRYVGAISTSICMVRLCANTRRAREQT